MALPTSFGFFAWLEITTAPSIPIKHHKVTSIGALICEIKFPRCNPCPQNPQKNVGKRKKINIQIKIIAKLINLIITVIVLRKVASLTPLRTKKL